MCESICQKMGKTGLNLCLYFQACVCVCIFAHVAVYEVCENVSMFVQGSVGVHMS